MNYTQLYKRANMKKIVSQQQITKVAALMKKTAAPWLQKALTSAIGTSRKTPLARLK